MTAARFRELKAGAQPIDETERAEYQRQLAAYTQARQKFDDEANAYWKSIADKRRQRNAKRRHWRPVV